jgi:cytochrome P450
MMNHENPWSWWAYRKDMVTRQWSIFNKKTSDPSWHAARKAVAPAFSSAALRQHVQSTHVATLRGLLRRMDAHAADAAPWPVAVDTYTFALDALMVE